MKNCSFCGRYHEQVDTLIESQIKKGKMICNFCIDKFVVLLQQNDRKLIKCEVPLK